jgi:hypothetical protein
MFAVKPLRILQQKLTVAKANTALQNGAESGERTGREMEVRSSNRREKGTRFLFVSLARLSLNASFFLRTAPWLKITWPYGASVL